MIAHLETNTATVKSAEHAALNWSADRLAEKAGVNVDMIRPYESGADAIAER